jgi:hypothetical protein
MCWHKKPGVVKHRVVGKYRLKLRACWLLETAKQLEDSMWFAPHGELPEQPPCGVWLLVF